MTTPQAPLSRSASKSPRAGDGCTRSRSSSKDQMVQKTISASQLSASPSSSRRGSKTQGVYGSTEQPSSGAGTPSSVTREKRGSWSKEPSFPTISMNGGLKRNSSPSVSVISSGRPPHSLSGSSKSCSKASLATKQKVLAVGTSKRGSSKGDGAPQKPHKAEDSPLWQALQSGKYDVATELLRSGQGVMDVNVCDSMFGWSTLHFAANHGQESLLKALCDARADPQALCENGNTPLHFAARGGHLHAVEYLLVSREDMIDGLNGNGWTAAMWGAINGHTQVVMTLVSARAQLNFADNDGRTIQMWAARHGHVEIVRECLRLGFNVLQEDNTCRNVIHHACEHSELQALTSASLEADRLLLDGAKRADATAVGRAIKAGANPNSRDSDGWSPLNWATLHGSLELLQFLVRHGADPGEEAEVVKASLGPRHAELHEALDSVLAANGRLLRCCRAGDWELMKQELRIGAWIDVREPSTLRSPLAWAASHGAPSPVMLLANAQANLEQRDRCGWTAMLHGVASRSPSIVSALWYFSASLQSRSYEGNTVLHLAARADDPAMLQIILAADPLQRCDIDELDLDDRTPLQVACIKGNPLAVNALLAYKAKTDVKDIGSNWTILHLAVVHGNLSVGQVLLSQPTVPDLCMSASHTQLDIDDFLSVSDKSIAPSIAPSLASASIACFAASIDTSVSRNSLTTEDSKKTKGLPTITRSRSKSLTTPQISGNRSLAKSNTAAPRTALGEEGNAMLSGSPRVGRGTSKSPLSLKVDQRRAIKRGKFAPSTLGEKDLLMLGKEKPEQRSLAGLLVKAQNLRETLSKRLPPGLKPSAILAETDSDGCAALGLAAGLGRQDFVELLLRLKAGLELKDTKGMTALMSAAKLGDRYIVDLLLRAKASVDLQNKCRKTAIQLTKNNGVRWLLQTAAIDRRLPECAPATEDEPAQGDAEKLTAGVGATRGCKIQLTKAPPTFRVRFENLPKTLTPELLQGYILLLLQKAKTGAPWSVDVIADPISRYPRGFAYVHFTKSSGADAAMRCDGSMIRTCTVRVFKESGPP